MKQAAARRRGLSFRGVRSLVIFAGRLGFETRFGRGGCVVPDRRRDVTLPCGAARGVLLFRQRNCDLAESEKTMLEKKYVSNVAVHLIDFLSGDGAKKKKNGI